MFGASYPLRMLLRVSCVVCTLCIVQHIVQCITASLCHVKCILQCIVSNVVQYTISFPHSFATHKKSRTCILTERTKILYPSTLLSIFSIFKLSSIHINQSALLGNTATNCKNTQDTHGHFVLLVNNFITSLFHQLCKSSEEKINSTKPHVFMFIFYELEDVQRLRLMYVLGAMKTNIKSNLSTINL